MSHNNTSPEITLITPMYNEQDCIAENIQSLCSTLKSLNISWEYIVVNDGSTDNSLEEARKSIGKDNRCQIISYTPNRGRGYALRQGFAAARGRYIITTESDLSWGADIVRKLYEELRTGSPDIVIASVNLPTGGLRGVPRFRSVLSKVGNRIMRWAFDGNLTMLSGMTRGYRREVIDALLLEESRKEIHLEIITKSQALGFNIVEIPASISWEGSSRHSTRIFKHLGILRFVIPHILLSLQQAAVKLFILGFCLTAVLGLVMVVAGILHKLFIIFPYPLPNLVIYGLILCSTAALIAMFLVVSVQLRYLHRSLICTQTQLKLVMKQLDTPDTTSLSSETE